MTSGSFTCLFSIVPSGFTSGSGSFTCLLSVPFLTFLGWVYSAICWTEFDLCIFCSYARLDLCDFFIHGLCFVISFSAEVVINPGLDLDWFGCVISFTFPSRWYFTDWTWYQRFLHPRISAIWLFTDCAWSLWFLHPWVVLDLCIRGPLFSLRFVFFMAFISQPVFVIDLCVRVLTTCRCNFTSVWFITDLPSWSVPAVDLSVSPFGFYLCVLGSFPWVWTVYL